MFVFKTLISINMCKILKQKQNVLLQSSISLKNTLKCTHANPSYLLWALINIHCTTLKSVLHMHVKLHHCCSFKIARVYKQARQISLMLLNGCRTYCKNNANVVAWHEKINPIPERQGEKPLDPEKKTLKMLAIRKGRLIIKEMRTKRQV